MHRCGLHTQCHFLLSGMAEKISKGERKISKKKKDTETKIKIEIETESKNNQQQGRCLLRGARFGVCV